MRSDELDHTIDGEDDVLDGAATGEVGNGELETLENRAGDSEAGKLFESFVENIASIEVGCNEDVGSAGDWGLGRFFLTNARIDGGVELELAVDENGGIFESVDDELSVSDGIVVATATEGGKREQSQAGCAGENGQGGMVSLMDNF